MTTPPPPPASDDLGTRDLGTLTEDGPQATQFEAPTARQSEAPQNVNAGTGASESQMERPNFSPVKQPGMVEEIHWHTVKSEQRAGSQEPPPEHTRGMIGRFHQGKHHHGGKHHGGKHHGGKGGGG